MGKTLTGTVVSDKADKTIVISVLTRKTHPIYKKQYTVTTKFMAHDENNDCRVGDRVTIEETRPLSAKKRFKLSKIVEKAKLSEKDLGAIDKSAEQEREKVLEVEDKKPAEHKKAPVKRAEKAGEDKNKEEVKPAEKRS